jgi:hypothetical protein
MAYQAHIVIPGIPEHNGHVIDHIRRDWSKKYGGVSMYDGHGSWLAGTGDIITEPHSRIITTVTVPEDDIKSELRSKAEYVKDELDEDAVLIEVIEVERELV